MLRFMDTGHERPPAPPRALSTGVSGWLLRTMVTMHTVAAFGQPVFAGVYLSGEIAGLSRHTDGANVAFSLGLVQTVVAVVVVVRMRHWWPAVVSAAILAAEWVQYTAGMSGTLWLHIPLGVAIIAALAVLFVAVWTRPFPTGAATGRRARVSIRHPDGADV